MNVCAESNYKDNLNKHNEKSIMQTIVDGSSHGDGEDSDFLGKSGKNGSITNESIHSDLEQSSGTESTTPVTIARPIQIIRAHTSQCVDGGTCTEDDPEDAECFSQSAVLSEPRENMPVASMETAHNGSGITQERLSRPRHRKPDPKSKVLHPETVEEEIPPEKEDQLKIEEEKEDSDELADLMSMMREKKEINGSTTSRRGEVCSSSSVSDEPSPAYKSFLQRSRPWQQLESTGVSCGTDACSDYDEDDNGGGIGVGNSRGIAESGFCSDDIGGGVRSRGGVGVTICTQADPLKTFLEARLIPFLRDPTRTEYRIDGRLKPEAKVAVKAIASEHDLIMRQFGKGKHQYVAIRKHASIITSQQVEVESRETRIREKRLAEKQRILREQEEELERKRKLLEEPPIVEDPTCETWMQADLDVEENELDPSLAGVIGPVPPGARPPKVESSMQTCSEGFYTCVYCGRDILEETRDLHHPACMTQYRLKILDNMRASGQNKTNSTPGASGSGTSTSKKTPGDVKSKSKSRLESARSKSRGRSKSRSGYIEVDDQREQLDCIHSNDLNSLIRTAHHMDTHCAAKKCKRKAKICEECHRSFCPHHTANHSCCLPPEPRGGALYKTPTPAPQNGLMMRIRYRKAPPRPVTPPLPPPDDLDLPIPIRPASPPPPPTTEETAEPETPQERRDQLKKNLKNRLACLAERRK